MRGRLFDAPRRLREYYYTTRDESTPRPSRLHRARASVASSERLGDRVRVGRRHGFRAPEGLADGGDHHGQRDACRGGKRRCTRSVEGSTTMRRGKRARHEASRRSRARVFATLAHDATPDAFAPRWPGGPPEGARAPGPTLERRDRGKPALTEPRMGNVSATRGRRAGAYRERR